MTTSTRGKLSGLSAKRCRISQRLATCERLIKGSLVINRRRCGKRGCRCAEGQLHESLAFTYKRAGKNVLVHIPAHLQAEARRAQKDYRKLKSLLEQLSELNLELLKHKARKDPSRTR